MQRNVLSMKFSSLYPSTGIHIPVIPVAAVLTRNIIAFMALVICTDKPSSLAAVEASCPGVTAIDGSLTL